MIYAKAIFKSIITSFILLFTSLKTLILLHQKSQFLQQKKFTLS